LSLVGTHLRVLDVNAKIREISKAKSSLGVEPFMVGGQTLFNTLDSPIFVSYGIQVIDQTYFMIHLIGKK
jgi:hypothetical protein